MCVYINIYTHEREREKERLPCTLVHKYACIDIRNCIHAHIYTYTRRHCLHVSEKSTSERVAGTNFSAKNEGKAAEQDCDPQLTVNPLVIITTI